MEISKRIKDRSAVVCVVGVGYVGFPLAEAFSEHLKVIGYDLNGKKVEELKMQVQSLQKADKHPK